MTPDHPFAGFEGLSYFLPSSNVDEEYYETHAPRLYGAAMAAAGDRVVAFGVARELLAAEDTSIERALLLAARRSPHGPFAAASPPARDALVLARLGGYPVTRIAATLETTREDVKRRLKDGLKALLTAASPRMQQPLSDCGNGASRALGARGS